VQTFSADCLSLPSESITCNTPGTFYTSTTKDTGDQVVNIIEIRQIADLIYRQNSSKCSLKKYTV